MLSANSVDETTLVKITVDREGLKTMIHAAIAAIKQADEWNNGDEFDINVTPYHEMKESLIAKYNSVFGEEEFMW